MTELARTGIGGTLEVGNGASPEVFTAIAEIVSVDGPSLSIEEKDATTLDSGGVKQSIPGLVDYGQLDIELLFTKHSTHTALRNDATARAERNYRITFPTSPTTIGAFSGYVNKWGQNMNPNDPMRANVGLKINSAVSWT